MRTCFADKIKSCEESLILGHFGTKFDIVNCNLIGYIQCWSTHYALEYIPTQHLSRVFKCIQDQSDIGTYAKECYEEHVKQHSNVVYTQNPQRSIWKRFFNNSLLTLSNHLLVAKLIAYSEKMEAMLHLVS
jgi:hypothetical protein